MEETEKLISLVRESVFLWSISHEDWKNTGKKAKQWADIGKELNQSGQEVSKKWKNLRDCYLKYLKAVKGSTGAEKRYINWPWAGQLEFLRDSLSQRTTASNIGGDTQVDIEGGSESEETQILPTASESEETQMPPPAKERRSSTKEENTDVTRVLNYLKDKNEKKSNSSHDRIDNLFLSYAETFKSFSPRTQAQLKMQMAQMFGRAELEELDARTSSPNPTSGQSSFDSFNTRSSSRTSSPNPTSGQSSFDSFNTRSSSRNSYSNTPPTSTGNARQWYEDFNSNVNIENSSHW